MSKFVLSAVMVAAVSILAPARASLVLRYSFDESSAGNEPALDSGSGVPAPGYFFGQATRIGNTPGGLSRGALNLRGGDSANSRNYLATADDADKLDGLAQMTVSMWVYHPQRFFGDPYDAYVSNDVDAADPLEARGWEFSSGDNRFAPAPPIAYTRIRQGLALNGEVDESGIVRGPVDAEKRWMFIAATFDASQANRMELFYGSETIAVEQLGDHLNAGADFGAGQNTGRFYVGTRDDVVPAVNWTPRFWIDDVRVYDEALSATELELVRRSNVFRPGDYDLDFDVDGNDFLVWQRSYGSTVNLGADGDGNGRIDSGDLSIWRQGFGASSSASTSGVPEPPTAAFTVAAVFAAGMTSFRPSRRQRL